MRRISVRLEEELDTRLKRESARTGQTAAELVRDALRKHLPRRKKAKSAYDAAVELGIVGAMKGAPPDLSTNPEYMERFGED